MWAKDTAGLALEINTGSTGAPGAPGTHAVLFAVIYVYAPGWLDAGVVGAALCSCISCARLAMHSIPGQATGPCVSSPSD